ncbi:MAG: hypothetical protein ACRCW2_05775 [Cellulosilyticaceae bacterium]
MEGILLKNEVGYYVLGEAHIFMGQGEAIVIFDEDEQEWLEGTVEVDEFGEYFFTDGFLVQYLYEGLPAKV